VAPAEAGAIARRVLIDDTELPKQIELNATVTGSQIAGFQLFGLQDFGEMTLKALIATLGKDRGWIDQLIAEIVEVLNRRIARTRPIPMTAQDGRDYKPTLCGSIDAEACEPSSVKLPSFAAKATYSNRARRSAPRD
jgi:hypothetical protein